MNFFLTRVLVEQLSHFHNADGIGSRQSEGPRHPDTLLQTQDARLYKLHAHDWPPPTHPTCP